MRETLTIKGLVKVIGETQVISEKFKKRDFVITVADDNYPQHISIQCVNDKVSLLDNLATGQEMVAHCNLQGREWTSPAGEVKYFNTITCWKLDIIGEKKEPQPVEKDDLPF